MIGHMVVNGIDLCFYLGAFAGALFGVLCGWGSGYVKGHRVALIDFHRATRTWYPEDEVHGNLK